MGGLLLAMLLSLIGCSNPFEVKQDFKPMLVIYGLAVRGDTAIYVRVSRNSASPATSLNDTSGDGSVTVVVENLNTGWADTLTSMAGDTGILVVHTTVSTNSVFRISAQSSGYPTCFATAQVLSKAYVVPGYGTSVILSSPSGATQDPEFLIDPSGNTTAISALLALTYSGTDTSGHSVAGEFDVYPSYQTSAEQEFLKINGNQTTISFPLNSYQPAYLAAKGLLRTGSLVVVVRVIQVDAAVYDYYSISHGFNDPLTMRDEKPNFTNITNGLGLWGSVAYDSTSVQL